MRLSVIMSVFNAEETLEESIESILNQTFKDFELLICNDASTDTSSKIIKRFKDKDTRIKMFENTVNIGLTKSLNTLIKNSQLCVNNRRPSSKPPFRLGSSMDLFIILL